MLLIEAKRALLGFVVGYAAVAALGDLDSCVHIRLM